MALRRREGNVQTHYTSHTPGMNSPTRNPQREIRRTKDSANAIPLASIILQAGHPYTPTQLGEHTSCLAVGAFEQAAILRLCPSTRLSSRLPGPRLGRGLSATEEERTLTHQWRDHLPHFGLEPLYAAPKAIDITTFRQDRPCIRPNIPQRRF